MAQSINESKTDYTIQYNNSVYNPYDLNNNYIIEISEISAAVDDFLNGQLSISEISELVDFFLSGDEYDIPVGEPEILSSSSYIEYDDFHLVGEVQNNLDQNIEYVKIIGTFYNEYNEVIGTDYTYTDIDILKPGQKSPFELTTYPDSFIPASYKLQLSYSTTSSEPYENVIIKSHTSDNDGDYFEVVGEVQNDGEETVEYVKIIGTFYNEDDIVIGKDYSYSTLDIITSGDTSPFELSSFPQTINPSRYDLQTQARVVD
ncbi:FxLYD domain-containing protein [Methanohalophilus halophilus]|nr:FxLYD domain-containing protein [Methanohalophilus halophilus]